MLFDHVDDFIDRGCFHLSRPGRDTAIAVRFRRPVMGVICCTRSADLLKGHGDVGARFAGDCVENVAGDVRAFAGGHLCGREVRGDSGES